MFPLKYAFCLSLVCFCMVLLESSQIRALQLREQLFDGSAVADSMEDLENPLFLEDFRSISPGTHRRFASKRGFVRLG